MVIDDLNIEGVPVRPPETNTPLVIDANAVLPLSAVFFIDAFRPSLDTRYAPITKKALESGGFIDRFSAIVQATYAGIRCRD